MRTSSIAPLKKEVGVAPFAAAIKKERVGEAGTLFNVFVASSNPSIYNFAVELVLS